MRIVYICQECEATSLGVPPVCTCVERERGNVLSVYMCGICPNVSTDESTILRCERQGKGDQRHNVDQRVYFKRTPDGPEEEGTIMGVAFEKGTHKCSYTVCPDEGAEEGRLVIPVDQLRARTRP